MAAGMTLVAGSLLVDSTFDASTTFWNILPALLLGGVGMGLAMTPTTAAAMGSVEVDKAGVGSAVLNSMRQVGGSLGIAVMGAIVAAYVTAPRTSPEAIPQFIDGFQHAVLVAAGIAFAGAIVAVATVRKYRHAEEAEALLEAA
jgi:hypothetical protein